MTETVTYTQFWDSANIENLKGLDRVILYIDGKYDQSAYTKDFKYTRLITIYGNLEAGILDYESGNPLYGDIPAVRKYLEGRANMDRRGRIYADRSDTAALYPQIKDLPHKWHIATLDNHEWQPAELQNNILVNWHVDIPLKDIWACQWKGGPNALRDQSSLYRYW